MLDNLSNIEAFPILIEKEALFYSNIIQAPI